MFNSTRDALKILGLPIGDYLNAPASEKRFKDGCSFRIEIPTVNSIETLEALLEEGSKIGVNINRITETYGIFRHTKPEIKKMVQTCQEYGCEFVMSTGPRASYDTSATAASVQGKTIGYRLRGQEQVVRAIEDIKRALDLGVSMFLVYDEGLLWALSEMRNKSLLPKNIKFKLSAHCGHGNPAAFKLLESIGANSINPVRDLQIPMLASLRQAIDIPLDCHTDNPPSSGGFIRVYEAPDIVRVASPVYLKTGNSALSQHGSATNKNDGLKMARQASIVLELVNFYTPEAKQSKIGSH